MTRNLKALLVSAMAVLAIGVVGAQAAQGAEFHSSLNETTLTAATDGTGKGAHQVLDAAGASLTCAGIQGDGTMKASTVTTITLDVGYESACTFIGQEATVEMRGCDFTFTSHGTFSIDSSTGGNCQTEPWRFSVPSPPCTVTIGPTGNQALESMTFHNVTNASGSKEITVEPHISSITYTAVGSGCPETGTKTDGNYTTGNFLITGEIPGTQAMGNLTWE